MASFKTGYDSEPELVCPACGRIYAFDGIRLESVVCGACGALTPILAIAFPPEWDGLPKSLPHNLFVRGDSSDWTIGARVRRSWASAFNWFLTLVCILAVGTPLSGELAASSPAFFVLPFTVLPPLAFAVMSTWGRYEIRVEGNLASVLVGAGKFVWVRHFDWRELHFVRLKVRHGPKQSQRFLIELEARKTIEFGGLLMEDQRRYLAAAIAQRAAASKRWLR